MEVGMVGVGHINDVEGRFEASPDGDEEGRGKRRRGGGRVRGGLHEIEVTADEGRKRWVGSKHGFNQRGLKEELAGACFEVDIE